MRIKLIVLFSSLFLVYSGATAQLSCSIQNPEDQKTTYQSLNSSNARKGKFRISINPVILHPSDGTQIFTEQDVLTLLNKANEYFAPINYEFQIVNSGIKHVFNDRFYNLEVEKEDELRELYDVNFAINLYFASTLILPNKDILSGYTSLPTLKEQSNRIILSYLDRNKEDFTTLNEKVFPHELGHYFGLLHTFQNSDSDKIEERELVTRDVGANCSTAGDFLCDTPADPYERLTGLAAFQCSEALPLSLQDAWGANFAPLKDNLMSYHIRCGNTFTQQQLERMQAAGSVRFSPNANYKILQSNDNSLLIDPLDKNVFCAGEIIELKWEAFGYYFQDNKFSFEISDENGENFKAINTAIVGNKAFISLPITLNPGFNYRIRLASSNPIEKGTISDNIEIRTKGEINITSNLQQINKGESAQVNLNFTGSGPWSINLNSGLILENLFVRNYPITVQPDETTDIRVLSATGACGAVEKSNILRINVSQPTLEIQTINPSFCEGSIVELPVQGLKNNLANTYTVLIESGKSYLIAPLISQNKLIFSLPSELKSSEKYRLSIKGNGPGDFSEKVNLTILSKPSQPFVQSPVEVCFNQQNVQLQAEGDQLKWYESNVASSPQNSIIPNTSKEGSNFYYVSQSNENGCESEKSKIEVNVKSPLTANISGDNAIMQGDSSQLRLQVAGEGPFEVVLNDGTTLFLNSGNAYYFVQPEGSFTYLIKEVKNGCGVGFTSGQAKIEVQLPLSLGLELTEEVFYPNPSTGTIFLPELSEKLSNVTLTDLNGRQTRLYPKPNNSVQITKTGSFILTVHLKNGKSISKKVVINP